MKTKEQKLALLDVFIECLDIPCEDIIKHLLSKYIKPGMFWYEDDTFSFDRIADKKIKAIVELVENGIVYGDLTASELFDFSEKDMGWYSTEKFFKEFSYPCKANEKIVWYNIDQLQNVYDNYIAVEKTFDKIHKPCRRKYYWTSTIVSKYAMILCFTDGTSSCHNKCSHFYFRPVLASKIS